MVNWLRYLNHCPLTWTGISQMPFPFSPWLHPSTAVCSPRSLLNPWPPSAPFEGSSDVSKMLTLSKMNENWQQDTGSEGASGMCCLSLAHSTEDRRGLEGTWGHRDKQGTWGAWQRALWDFCVWATEAYTNPLRKPLLTDNQESLSIWGSAGFSPSAWF